MDTQKQAISRMDIPRNRRSFITGVVISVFYFVIVVNIVDIAISNLTDYKIVSIITIIWSLFLLLTIAGYIIHCIFKEHGIRLYILNRLSKFSSRQFVEIIPQHSNDLIIRFGFTLLGHDFTHIQILNTDIVSISWSSAQAKLYKLAGNYMEDWQVNLRYQQKGSKRQVDTGLSKEELYAVNPLARKNETIALGESLIEYFRSSGIELHPTMNEFEFTTQKQDDIGVELPTE